MLAFMTGLPPLSFTLPFLSIHKMVTQCNFNNLYFHIRGFPLRPTSATTADQWPGVWLWRVGKMGLELFYNAYLCEALYFRSSALKSQRRKYSKGNNETAIDPLRGSALLYYYLLRIGKSKSS